MMNMAIEVFNRCEKKYIMNEETYLKVVEKIKDYMLPDAYNQNGEFYTICNIYYDTVNDRLIRNSIEKPVYKEKLRVRSYGVPKPDDLVFVEIKKKYNGIVNKRRTSMRLSDAYEYLENKEAVSDVIDKAGLSYEINKQVLREIDYFKNYYEIVPKLCLCYDRYAYFGKHDNDFRITFDTNIRTRRDDLRLEHGDYGEQLLDNGSYLMEVKANGAIPLWFAKIISEFNIYPASFSKYGTEYKRYLQNNYTRKDDKICLKQFLPQQQKTQSILASQF